MKNSDQELSMNIKLNRENYYSPENLLQRAIDDLYRVYLQMYLPCPLKNDLRESAERCVKEYAIIRLKEFGKLNPGVDLYDWCDEWLEDTVATHAAGKGDEFMDAHMKECGKWIGEAIQLIRTQLTESDSNQMTLSLPEAHEDHNTSGS